jgi:uncharacterized protein
MDALILTVVILAITGSIIGFASGFLGVGGGFLMVPVQFWLLTFLGTDPTLAIRIAFGTSLAVIIPTAISGSWAHHCRKCVLVRPLTLMIVPAVIGSISGATIATHVPGPLLEFFFGILILVAAMVMLLVRAPPDSLPMTENRLVFVFWGLTFGCISGLLGIGGGIVMVPVMILILRFPLHKAIGTSTVLMVFSSIGGAITYIVNGLSVPGLPPYSFGYVNLLQWGILAAVSVPMAQVGVRAVHRFSAGQVKIVFCIVMIVIGLHMIGIF